VRLLASGGHRGKVESGRWLRNLEGAVAKSTEDMMATKRMMGAMKQEDGFDMPYGIIPHLTNIPNTAKSQKRNQILH
jgi:hypothetical protein